MDLIPDKKILTIGKMEIDYSRVSARRALEAMKIYNAVVTRPNDSDLVAVEGILDAVLVLIRIDFSWSRVLDWERRRRVTKKYILQHLDFSELSKFVEEALDPILGDKKKAAEHREKLMEVERELLKKVEPAILAQWLESLLSSLDGPLNTSSPSPSTKSSTSGKQGSATTMSAADILSKRK